MNKIIGVTVGTPVPQSDLGQTDPTKADYVKNKHLFSNAIKSTVSGNPVALTDVSPLEHEVKVVLSGEQEVVVRVDSTIQDESITIDVPYTVKEVAKEDISGEDYFFSWRVNVVFEELPNEAYIYEQEESEYEPLFQVGDKVIFRGTKIGGVTYKIPYISRPRTNFKGVTVQQYGENLIPYPYINIPTENAGVSFTANGDGTITMNGTATSTPSITFSSATLPKGTYRISSGVASSHGVSVRVYDSKGTNIGHSIASSIQSFTITEPTSVTFRVVGTIGKKYENLVIYPQLKVGTTESGFEPFKEPTTYTADKNGNVSGIVANGENMTLIADSGITISAEYSKDSNKVIQDIYQKLSALGVAVVNN